MFLRAAFVLLAVVLVGEDGETEGPYYVRQPFSEPDRNAASVNYDLGALLQKAARDL